MDLIYGFQMPGPNGLLNNPKVRVDILQPKGTPLTREVVCRSGTLTIDR